MCEEIIDYFFFDIFEKYDCIWRSVYVIMFDGILYKIV